MNHSARRKQNRRFCQNMPGMDLDQHQTPLEQVLAYHRRSKHGVNGYAAGPASLDWESQPSPYRSYPPCQTISLPFCQPQQPYQALFEQSISAAPLSLTTVAQLFEYSLSLAAVKVFGSDSWTVRCNPSSGNLHPTEAYLICGNLSGLEQGIYHYQSQQHQLEQRGSFNQTDLPEHIAYIALSSVYWREAWKYGERAYRYCQLDVGHAIAALRYSAAMLGWQLSIEDSVTDDELAALCGIDQHQQFDGVESESPDLLLRIHRSPSMQPTTIQSLLKNIQWHGLPNLLDSHPFYDWQIIKQVSNACHKKTASTIVNQNYHSSSLPAVDSNAAKLIKQRRSALAFQANNVMSRQAFIAILQALLPNQRHIPFDLFSESEPITIHPILFVHRVEGVIPGIYALPRSEDAKQQLQQAMDKRFVWQQLDPSLPLYLLESGDAQAISKRINCHQAIASESAFSLGMLAEFSSTLNNDDNAWRYRELYWQAGVLGQVLYLEAEAHHYRGTGIGCFLDDLFHQLLGLEDQQFQSLYHFTVGSPVVDERISSLSPY